jgi:hypothetical protein
VEVIFDGVARRPETKDCSPPNIASVGAHPGLFAVGRLKTGLTLEQARA